MKRTMLGHKLNAKMSFKGHSSRPMLQLKNQKAAPIINLTKYDNLILDQGQEGDCTAASSGGVWTYLQILKWRIANKGYTSAQLQQFIATLPQVSMDFIYALELTYDGDFGADNGSYGSTAAYVLETFGACYADMWPNNGDGFDTYPSSAAMQAAAKNKVGTFQLLDLQQVRQNNTEGYPCFFGIPVYPSFANSPEVMETGVIPMPQSFETIVGGHEIKCIGHDDTTGMLLIDNSWGTGVGIEGRFHMPYAYFEKYASDVHTARLV